LEEDLLNEILCLLTATAKPKREAVQLPAKLIDEPLDRGLGGSVDGVVVSGAHETILVRKRTDIAVCRRGVSPPIQPCHRWSTSYTNSCALAHGVVCDSLTLWMSEEKNRRRN